MIEQVLQQNGFSSKEARVYLAALEAGEATVSDLASKTRLKRTTVYNVIDGLVSRGLLTIQKRRGIKRVLAVSPRVLIDRFRNAASLAENALPSLLEMAYASPFKPRIRFFEGMDGLKEILREVTYAQYAEPGMIFTDYEHMPKELLEFIRKELVPYRRTHGKFLHIVMPHSARNLQMQRESDQHYAEHRIIRFPAPSDPIELTLFSETKVGFLSFGTNELFGVVIDSKAIHQTLKNLFLFIWDKAERNQQTASK